MSLLTSLEASPILHALSHHVTCFSFWNFGFIAQLIDGFIAQLIDGFIAQLIDGFIAQLIDGFIAQLIELIVQPVKSCLCVSVCVLTTNHIHYT